MTAAQDQDSLGIIGYLTCLHSCFHLIKTPLRQQDEGWSWCHLLSPRNAVSLAARYRSLRPPYGRMPLRERCPQPGGFGCGGDFAGPIQSPFTNRGLSEWGDRVLVSAFIIIVLLVYGLIIQEGERMTRMGTFALKFDQQSYKPFMLYWKRIKATNFLNAGIFA